MMRRRKSKYVSYERCKDFAQSLGVKTMKEWIEMPKLKNIPDYPSSIYKNKGWVNWYVFLDKPPGRAKKEFMSYEDAVKWIRKKGIKSIREFKNAKRVPDNFPSQPDVKYKDNGWISWMHFFGKLDAWGNPDQTQGMGSYRKNFISYDDARKYMIERGITSRREFETMRKRPNCIPALPAVYYKDKGWKNWCHFLGKEYKIGRPKKKELVN